MSSLKAVAIVTRNLTGSHLDLEELMEQVKAKRVLAKERAKETMETKELVLVVLAKVSMTVQGEVYLEER